MGILAFVLAGGVDKFSIILGLFFIVCSVLSFLRQTGSLQEELELPFLVMLIGALTFVPQLRLVPVPKWFFATHSQQSTGTDKR